VSHKILRDDRGEDFAYSEVNGVLYPKVHIDSQNFTQLESFEGFINGVETIDFGFTSGKIVISNDHKGETLLYKANVGSANWCTLYPNESVNMEFATPAIEISGQVVPYRIWVFA